MEATHKLVMQSLLNKNLITIGKDFEISDNILQEFLNEYKSLSGTQGNLSPKQTKFAKKLAAKNFLDLKLEQGFKPKEGFLYVIENPAWPGKYKIGMTWYPYKRLSQYQTYSPLRDFSLKHWSFWQNKKLAEKLVHSFLKDKIYYEWANLTDKQLVELQRLLNNSLL